MYEIYQRSFRRHWIAWFRVESWILLRRVECEERLGTGVYFRIGGDSGGESARVRLSLSWKCRKLWFPRTIRFVGESSPRANEISSTSESGPFVCSSSGPGISSPDLLERNPSTFSALVVCSSSIHNPAFPFPGTTTSQTTAYHMLAIHYAILLSLSLSLA